MASGGPMRWSYCGHAMWLVEADGLRFVCDPLLGATHHAGVFEVVPRRTIDAGALRPDVLLVSHRHGDHFDVPSLHRLAQLDPDTVVLTPDALVAWAARALGFHDVRETPAGTLLAFEGVSLVTTPSRAPDEWGVMFGVGGVAAWNQVDSVFTGPDDIREVTQIATRALGARRLTMAAVRWQPMLEIAAQLGESLAFPTPPTIDCCTKSRRSTPHGWCRPRPVAPTSARGRGSIAWCSRWERRAFSPTSRGACRAPTGCMCAPVIACASTARASRSRPTPQRRCSSARATTPAASHRCRSLRWSTRTPGATMSPRCSRGSSSGCTPSWHPRWRLHGRACTPAHRCAWRSRSCGRTAAPSEPSWSPITALACSPASTPTGTRSIRSRARCCGK
ncbi:MAG: MBL fold metallo-hydrolase [Deltaproteobacteria bacterium]|nr:MBL fold metallo-hydrolase [Deltaproteobacteria bacterium]